MFAQFAGLVELAENDVAIGRVHAHPGIRDNHLYTAVEHVVFIWLDYPPGDCDPAGIWGELDGVGNQMVKEFFHQIRVC